MSANEDSDLFCFQDLSISTLLIPIFFVIFIVQFFSMKTTIQNAIYSAGIAVLIFLIQLWIKLKKKCKKKKQKVSNVQESEINDEECECCACKSYNIGIFYMIINPILSFLSTFTFVYLTKTYIYYGSDALFIFVHSLILATAHCYLLFPKESEFYSVSFSNYENSQTRCFSIILLSIGSIFLMKHDIDYLCIQKIFYLMLFFMVFDFAISFGLIGLPRSTIHWFIEFVNRYAFGFSGCTTIIDALFQLLRGCVSLAFCCVLLYFKNLFWSRMICLFFSSFVTSIEFNKKIVILSLIRSSVGSIFFIIFNYFLDDEKSSNIIEIIFIIYYIIFEFIIPYISSISCYLFFYVRLINNHRVLNYIRISISLISAPIIIGSLLSNDVHFVISSLLIVHSLNRSFSEPQVFGLALFIARFTLYNDFELTSNIALNFLLSLFISRKFFSVIDILYIRSKLSMGFLDTETCLLKLFFDVGADYSDLPPIVQIIIYYLKGILIIPSYCFYIPAFFWSLITGSPVNFLFLLHSYPQPYPPKSNLFWDDTAEKFSSNEHLIESFVYHSFVNSFKEKLFNIIKKGILGIVDENSFFLFHQDRSIILCHIISINTFYINFQLRCAEFTHNTLCHAGELSIFTNIHGENLDSLDIEKSIRFIKSIYSPVAHKFALYGYNYYPIDIKNAYVSLTPEQKKKWITYSLCFWFIKQNEPENCLFNLISEKGDTLIDEIKMKLDIIINRNKNTNTNNENTNTNNENTNVNNANRNRNRNENIDDPLFSLGSDYSNDSDDVSYDDSVSSLENENNNESNNVNENIINNENQNNNDENDHDNEHDEEVESDEESSSNELVNYVNNCPFDEDIYNLFEFNSQIIHDFLYNSYNIVNALMKRPTAFFTDYLTKIGETGVESFLNTVGMRSCLYMFLSSSYLAPEPDEFEEVKEFLNQTEEEYEICNNSDLKKILLEFRYNKNEMNQKYENKCFFSIIKNNTENKLTFIRKSESEWNVFRIERDFLRSIWASQCCDVLGFKNMENERFSLQEDVYHLNNLMNQISDVPMSYPAYVSNIEKSYLNENYLK